MQAQPSQAMRVTLSNREALDSVPHTAGSRKEDERGEDEEEREDDDDDDDDDDEEEEEEEDDNDEDEGDRDAVRAARRAGVSDASEKRGE